MISVSVSKVSLNHLKKNYKKVAENLPKKLGATAVRYTSDNFRKQGFDDQGVKRWQPRKSKKHKGRALLIKSGRLRRSIRIIRLTSTYVTVGSTEAHAKIHNQGGTINHPGGTSYFINKGGDAVFVSRTTAARIESKNNRVLPKTKPHRITIPARQFLPTRSRKSQTLNNRLKATVRAELKKINNK